MSRHIRDRLDEALRDGSAAAADGDVGAFAEIARAVGATPAAEVATAAGEARALTAMRATIATRRAETARSTQITRGMFRTMRSRPAPLRFAAMAAAAVVAVGAAAAAPQFRGPVMAVFSGSSSSVKAEVRLTSPINQSTGEPNDALASGRAKSEQRADRTRFALEVEGVQSEPGDYIVNLTHSGTTERVATVRVDALGFGELELNTRDGVPACPASPECVPVAVAGDTVEVLTPNGSSAVLHGTLASK